MSTLALAVVCCGLYPLVVFGIGQALFHDKANGSLIVDANGIVRGARDCWASNSPGRQIFSRRQSFRRREWLRCDQASGGSNLGPTSQKLHDSSAQNISDYRTQNGLATNAPVPADAVTASASEAWIRTSASIMRNFRSRELPRRAVWIPTKSARWLDNIPTRQIWACWAIPG